MTDDNSEARLEQAEVGSDLVIFELARQAGVRGGDYIEDIHEEYLDTVDEVGTYSMEAWTVFEAVDEGGQTYFAHLPGDLDSLIVRTVRDHAVWFSEE